MATRNSQPNTIERLGNAVYPSFAMLAGMQLDLFTPLKDGPMTAEQIADALGVRAAKLEPLLYALVAAELLTVEGDRFANTDEANTFLVRTSPNYLKGRDQYYSFYHYIINTPEGLLVERSFYSFDCGTSTTIILFMPVEERPDRELVASARQGDKAAFGVLAQRHQEATRRLALRMVSNPEVVQDLVQEALLEAYLSLDRLREPERFRSWLGGIVLNLCRSYLRERKRRGLRNANLKAGSNFDWWHLQSDLPGPEVSAEARELHRLVLSAIQDLPASQRQATLLFYYEYLSLREIAAVAGVSVGAVKVRLYRARQQLREHLLHQHPEVQPVSLRQARRQLMIRVHIADVIQQNGKTVVLLVDENQQRVLPIWIGDFEGYSIAMGVRDYTTLRPMTFNFLANMLDALGAELQEARVESLRDETFYGVAKVRIGNQIKEVDARPSDVLALAAHTGCPIYVAQTVMEKAGKNVEQGIDMPESLMGIEAMPLPSGEGIDAVLKEVEALMSRKSEGC